MRTSLRSKLLILLLFFPGSLLLATPDCPIVTERFTGLSDGTTVNNSSTGWYLDASAVTATGYFAVKSNRLHAQELGGVGIWYSRAFSTAGYSEFQVAVKVSSEGDMNSSEYVKIYYKINGGAEVLLDQRTGNFGTLDFISPVLTGNNVQLVVKMYNYNNGGSQTSKYYIEEYRVFKEHGACSGAITVSAAAANGGMLTCANSSITLTASSSASGVTYSWSGPNGFSSTSATPSISVAGTYTVVGSSTSGSGSASVTVTENKTPPAVTATGGALACGTSVTLHASSTTSGVNYSWSGPSGYTSTQQHPVVTAAGNYTVTVYNPANGCSASQTVSVTAGNGPSIFWEETFTAANGTTSRSGSPGWSLQNVAAGTFSVQNNELMAAFNAANEGIWLSDVFSISNKSSINLSIDLKSSTASTSDYLESDDYIRIYYKLNGGSEVQIFNNAAGLNGTTNTTSTLAFTSAIPNGSTLQIVVRLRNTHSTERYYFDNVRLAGLNASTAPAVNTSINGAVTCTTSAQLFATASTTATGYAWTGPNGFSSSSQNPVVNAGGQYTVTATLSGGCTVSAVVSVPENKAAPDLTASGGALGCLASIVLNANSTIAGATYSWSGPGFSSSLRNPTVTAAGTYTVTVTNPANGCTASQAVQVTAATGSTVTLFTQPFTASNGTTSASGSNAWSVQSSPSGSVFSVQGNQFQVSNTGTTGEGVWASGVMDISGKTNITISTGVRSAVTGGAVMNETGEFADYIQFYYKLNNGAEVKFAERRGVINSHSTALTSLSVSSLSGNTIQIIVRARATGADEFYHFDNVTVTGLVANTLSASATAIGTLSCANASIQITGSASTAGANYSWTGPGGFTATTQNVSVNTAGVYTLTVTDPSTGCTATDTANVIQSTGTTGLAWAADFTFADGTTSVSSGSTWSVQSSPSAAIFSVSSNQFRVSNTGTTGESVWASGIINIAGKTNVAIAAGVRSSITGGAVMNETGEFADYIQFYYKLNGGAEVKFAEKRGVINSHSTSLSPVSVSSLSGNTLQIIVRARATGIDEFYHFDNMQVSATTPAVNIDAIASANGKITCTNPSVLLTGNSTTAGVSYSWVAPGGNTFASQNLTVSTPGIYTLTVANGGCSATDTALVIADTAKPAAVQITTGANSQITCVANHVQLSASPSGAGLTYYWEHPNGLIIPATATNAFAAGNYTYHAVNTSNGCSAVASFAVVVNQTFPAGVSTSPNLSMITCNTPSITITGSSQTPGVSYSWTGPNGFTASVPVIVAHDSGSYNLAITNTANGCVTTVGAQVLKNVDTPTNVAISAPFNQLTCTNNQVTLTGSATAISISYSWTSNNGYTGSSSIANVSAAGIYTLKATNTVSGCFATASVQITENKLVPDGVSATSLTNLLDCYNPSTTLSGTSTTPNVSYSWTGPNGFTAPTRVTTIEAGGTYVVKVTNPVNGCFATASKTVLENKIPPANITAVNDGPIICTTSVNITGHSTTPGMDYLWTGPNDFIGFSAQETITEPGTYMLMVTDLENGCFDTASTVVERECTRDERVRNNGTMVLDGAVLHTPAERIMQFRYKAYPNPATSQAFIEFSAPENTQVTVGIYNSIGARQQVLFNGKAQAQQSYKLSLSAGSLPAGVYYYIIKTDTKSYTGKIIVVK